MLLAAPVSSGPTEASTGDSDTEENLKILRQDVQPEGAASFCDF